MERLLALLKKYASGTATPDEKAFVEEYYRYFDQEAPVYQNFSDAEKQSLETGLLTKIHLRITELESETHIVRVMPMGKKIARAVAVAAILLLMAGGAYVIISRNNDSRALAVTQYKGDVPAPAITKATLTVAGGKRIILDSVMSGSLAAQGAASADKTADGKLVYNSNSASTAIEYHTLTNPKASKPMELELPDKSIVWLNAESSITFPTAFTGNERVVTMTGEAYFEVVHDAKQPFKVKAGNQVIEDIGTAFNVNAYPDEPDTKITLFEGAASVSYGAQKKIVNAGEQSIIKIGAEVIEVKETDGQMAAAWRKGVFNFEHADIATIMRQLIRWYNVEVRYEGKSSLEPFSGEIGRSLTLVQVLNGLEQSKVHFRIEEDKRIVIMP